MGAKIELSRAYFEIGKNLLSPHSRCSELNGIKAHTYLANEKAMFEEMDLAWDLNELNKIKVAN